MKRYLPVALLFTTLLLFPLGVSTAVAQQDAADQAAKTPRPLKISDADDWQRVGGFELSPDGKWVSYLLVPGDGDAQLIIRKTEMETAQGAPAEDQPTQKEADAASESEPAESAESGESSDAPSANQAKDQPASDAAAAEDTDKHRPGHSYHFTVGRNSGQIAYSHDSRFVTFMQAPDEKQTKAAEKSKTPARNKAVLLNLATGEQVEFDKVQRFAFANENPDCLAVHKIKPKGRPEGEQGWDGTDLVVHQLSSGTQMNIGNVKSFAFNKPGTLLAVVMDAEDKSGNGLQLVHLDEFRLESLENDDATYRSLNWTREGDALALLKARQSKKYENPQHSVVAFSDVGGANQQRVDIDPTKQAAIPDDMTISPNRQPEWSDHRDLILFGIHELKAKEDDKGKSKPDKSADDSEKSTKDGDDEVADLVVWHWQDPRLQSMQQKQEARDKNESDLCAYQVENSKTLRLADDEIPEASVSRPHRFAIGTDDREYERFANLEGSRFRDVYVIDLKNGKRKLVIEKAQYIFGSSPDGTQLLYYMPEGHFYVYDMERSTHTNITENVETSFIDEEDDHNVENPPRRPLGWSSDSNHVMLSDGWDIWMVSSDGKGAVNLTVDGKEKQIRYRSPRQFDPDALGLDTSQPIYLTAYGEWTKQAGFGRLNTDQPGVEMLIWEDASFGPLNKLEDHEIYSWARSTHDQSNDYYIGGPDLKDGRQLTHANPQQKNFKWSAGVRLVDYTNKAGVKLQGALHLPADYIEGKRYPTIVYMYEKLSQNANRYDAPRTGGFSASIYTSNGFAVFNPDIVFAVNDPGMSSLDCIMSGLDAAIATGVVDPDHVGIHGHSWGGYQTAFLITQTDRFKAAVAGAPLTNLISMYSSIYWNSGSANQPIFERSQGRFLGGYWDNLDAYARNSPVYHAKQVSTPLVLLHNDQDGAVDWNQGIEYFNTLRRLDKPVVMLQYKGENHGLRDEANRKDYSYRMLDFFNHYLKGAEAPGWWSEGIKHLDMEDHIKEYKKAKASAARD